MLWTLEAERTPL
eukprot:gene26957-biopygen17532